MFIGYAVCGLFVFVSLRALGEKAAYVRGILQRPSFLLFGRPYTNYATLVFLFAVTALMCYEYYWNPVALIVIGPAPVRGWYAGHGRVLGMARERVGITRNYPVVADKPLLGEFLDKDDGRRE